MLRDVGKLIGGEEPITMIDDVEYQFDVTVQVTGVYWHAKRKVIFRSADQGRRVGSPKKAAEHVSRRLKIVVE